MCLVNFSMRGGPLKLDSSCMHGSSSTSLSQCNDPCKTDVHQQRRLFLMRHQPRELDGAFITAFDEADFLRTRELLIA